MQYESFDLGSKSKAGNAAQRKDNRGNYLKKYQKYV